MRLREELPQADVVQDQSHVTAWWNDAVDKGRRQEQKELMAGGDQRLKGRRQLWLYGLEKVGPERLEEFNRLRQLKLEVARAWAMKETFSEFWGCASQGWARRFLGRWFGWVRRSRLRPVVEVALMLKAALGEAGDVGEASDNQCGD